MQQPSGSDGFQFNTGGFPGFPGFPGMQMNIPAPGPDGQPQGQAHVSFNMGGMQFGANIPNDPNWQYHQHGTQSHQGMGMPGQPSQPGMGMSAPQHQQGMGMPGQHGQPGMGMAGPHSHQQWGPGQQPSGPGMHAPQQGGSQYATGPSVDDKLISDKSGFSKDYIDRVVKVLEHDHKTLSPEQFLKFYENVSFSDDKKTLLQRATPYLSSFDIDTFVKLLKKASGSDGQLHVVEFTHKYLPPGTSYQAKVEAVDKNLSFSDTKDKAKKLMGL